MLPMSQKLAGHSISILCEERSYCRHGTLCFFSVGRIVPGLWYDYRWLVCRYLGLHLQGCLLSCITCIAGKCVFDLPGFPSWGPSLSGQHNLVCGQSSCWIRIWWHDVELVQAAEYASGWPGSRLLMHISWLGEPLPCRLLSWLWWCSP